MSSDGPPRTKLFVGHLPDGCTNDDLFTLFSKYGKVTECDVINKYGFVHMSTPEEAQDALKALNNFYFKGSSLSVEPSKSKMHPEPGSQGRARTGSSRGRGGFGGSFRGNNYSNGYGRRFDGPSFGNGGRDFYPDRGYMSGSRMRPYPTPYDRPSPSMGPPRDEYSYRSSSYPSLRDHYAPRPPVMGSMSRDYLYERRETSYPTTSDYLYSRRSPTSQMSDPNRSYWYNDSMGDSMSRLPPSTSRRPYF
jgi:RNA recognition motif-containing protein